jgi:hypothetical protein
LEQRRNSVTIEWEKAAAVLLLGNDDQALQTHRGAGKSLEEDLP